jgi:hypothetical protein
MGTRPSAALYLGDPWIAPTEWLVEMALQGAISFSQKLQISGVFPLSRCRAQLREEERRFCHPSWQP